jgi:hypothetical protein
VPQSDDLRIPHPEDHLVISGLDYQLQELVRARQVWRANCGVVHSIVNCRVVQSMINCRVVHSMVNCRVNEMVNWQVKSRGEKESSEIENSRQTRRKHE